MKIFKWTVSVIIGLVVILAGLLYFDVFPGYHVYIVRSGSMSPAVNTGDLAIVVPTDSFLGREPGVGSIISYTVENETVTHRIIGINEDGSFITKGDDNEDPDLRPVYMSQVQGIYSFRIPYLGYVAGFTRTKVGWLTLIIIPGLLLAGWLIADIIRESLREDKNKHKVVKEPVKSSKNIPRPKSKRDKIFG